MLRLTPDTPQASAVLVPIVELNTLRKWAALGKSLAEIASAKALSPSERAVMATARISATEQDGNQFIARNKTIASLADDVGLSYKTVLNTCERFERTAALVQDKKCGTVNRYGEPIPTNCKNDEAGDRWKTTSTLYINEEPLRHLLASGQPLPRTTYDRAQAGKATDMRATLRRFLEGATCPECNEAGHLQGAIHIHCDHCHKDLTPAQVATVLAAAEPEEPVEPEENFSTTTRPQTRRRALRGLKGREIPPPPSVTYEFDDPADNDLIVPEKALVSSQVEKFTTPLKSGEVHHSEEALSVVPDGVPTLTGQAAVDHLAGLGGMFSLADSQKRGINGRDDMGAPVNFLDMPLAADSQAVRLHVAAGGSIGFLPAASNAAVVDIDIAGGEFIRAHPRLALADRIIRRNAPTRCKIVVMCPDPGQSRTFESADGTRKIELIGKGKHAIIAGTHETGAAVELVPGWEAVLMTWAELVTIAEEWTGEKQPAHHLSVSSVTTTRAHDQVRDAILWWCVQPCNQSAVDRLLDGCKRKGNYVSIRAGDGTPSTRHTGECDGRRTWRDYGSNRTLDDYELFCELTNTDKRADKWRVVNEWRESQGRPALSLAGQGGAR